MVAVVEQMCISAHKITVKSGDEWACKQGDKFTTTVPEVGKESITVFSDYWVSCPKDKFIPCEK